jgi:hypothetical protein
MHTALVQTAASHSSGFNIADGNASESACFTRIWLNDFKLAEDIVRKRNGRRGVQDDGHTVRARNFDGATDARQWNFELHNEHVCACGVSAAASMSAGVSQWFAPGAAAVWFRP